MPMPSFRLASRPFDFLILSYVLQLILFWSTVLCPSIRLSKFFLMLLSVFLFSFCRSALVVVWESFDLGVSIRTCWMGCERLRVVTTFNSCSTFLPNLAADDRSLCEKLIAGKALRFTAEGKPEVRTV